MHSLTLHSWFVALVLLSTENVVYCQVCSSSPCKNGGACLEAQDTFLCLCDDGFIGRRCEVAGMAMVCEHNTCGNGGTCTNPYGVITCDCLPEYTGSRCDTLVEEDPCSSSPCENGGSCQRSDDSFTCDCVEGYTGIQCTEKEDPCSSTPCENGGSCQRNNFSFTCQCPEGYTGNRCEVGALTDLCEPNPCLNGGICNRGTGEFSCICTEEYTGKMCENRQDRDLPTEDTIKHTTPSDLISTTESPGSKASESILIALGVVAAAVCVFIISFCFYLYISPYKEWKKGKDSALSNDKKDKDFFSYLTEKLQCGERTSNVQDDSNEKTELKVDISTISAKLDNKGS